MDKRDEPVNDFNHLNNINFKRNSGKRRFEKVIRLGLIISIAFVSGAAGSHYIIEERLNPKNLGSDIISRINSEFKENNIFNNAEAVHRSSINNITPYIVGITATKGGSDSNMRNIVSGVIIKSDGYIATNYNDIKDADNIMVKVASQGIKPIRADVVMYDNQLDIAVLKINMSGLPVIKCIEDNSERVGDKIVAVGNPLGEENSTFVTQGIISYISKVTVKGNNNSETQYTVFKTDAEINQYNSGGVICNQDGEALGIISSSSSNMKDGNVGMAVSIRDISNMIDNGGCHESSKKPILGFKGGDIKSTDDNIEGVYVQEVTKGYPLSNAGIRPTDVISGIDGKKIREFSDVMNIVAEHNINDELMFKIWRDGKNISIKVKLTQAQN